MNAIKRGLSNVVSELILILIAVFLATLLYVWVSNIFAVLGSGLLPPLAKISSVTIAYATLVNSTTQQYNYGYYLVVTLSNPQNGLLLNGIEIYSGNKLLCSANTFVQSADDASLGNGEALAFAGYYGNKSMVLDSEDSLSPGLILLSLAPQGDTINNVGNNSVGSTYFYPVDTLTSEEADTWVSVFVGTLQRHPVSYVKTETYLSKAPGTLVFRKLVGRTKVFYNSTSDTWVYVDSYQQVSLSRGTYTLVVWCKSMTLNEVTNLRVVISTNMYTISKTVNVLENI